MKPPLPPRQEQILRLISQGRTDRQIAGELGIAHATVRTHVRLLFLRLQVVSRAHAVSRWVKK